MRFQKWIPLKGRRKRHKRIRNKIMGTSALPRVSVFRSLSNLYVQLVDDDRGHTLFSLSTNDPEIRRNFKYGGNVAAAGVLGTALAQHAQAKGFKKVVFDRSGYLYHGRIKALAESARKGGLEF